MLRQLSLLLFVALSACDSDASEEPNASDSKAVVAIWSVPKETGASAYLVIRSDSTHEWFGRTLESSCYKCDPYNEPPPHVLPGPCGKGTWTLRDRTLTLTTTYARYERNATSPKSTETKIEQFDVQVIDDGQTLRVNKAENWRMNDSPAPAEYCP